MNKYQRIGIRVAISTNVGVLVAAIAIVVAWRDIGDTNRVRSEQWATRQAISDIKKSLQMYRGAGKPPPKSLEEFRGPGGEFPAQFQRDERGRPLVDGWGRPFLYSVEASEYVVTSLGRDGKPGGVGLDCDLSSLKEWPKEAVPTLGQVLGYPSTRGIICPCLACGVLAFLLSLATVNPRTIERQGVFPLVVQLGLTILGAVFLAYFLSLAQIANYH